MQLAASFVLTALFLLHTVIVQAQVVDIVETAINNGNFQTLVAALRAADLVNTLQGLGLFTVFAPNDAAFAKLSVGVVADLVKPENKPTLSRILLYHVTNGNLTATIINAMALPANVTMLAGGSVAVSKNETSLKVNNAVVTAADVFATNGVIHVLDSVLLPPLDIVETAIVIGIFKTLVAALRAADLVEALTGPGPFTVFAPSDAAFSKLPNGTVEYLLQPENREKLSNILKYHVITRRVTSGDINNTTLPATAEMLGGGTVTVTKDGNSIKINDATVTAADVSNTNGIIHIIDTVLIPSAPASNFTNPVSSSTTPVPGSATLLPTSTIPASSSETPAPSSTTPAPSSTTSAPSSSTPAPISTTSTSSSTTPAPGSTTTASSSATPFYGNQGFFTVFLSTIFFECLFSI